MRDPQLDLVLRGGTVVTVEGQRQADVGIKDGRVSVIRDRDASGKMQATEDGPNHRNTMHYVTTASAPACQGECARRTGRRDP